MTGGEDKSKGINRSERRTISVEEFERSLQGAETIDQFKERIKKTAETRKSLTREKALERIREARRSMGFEVDV